MKEGLERRGTMRRVAAACGSYDIDFRYRHLVLRIFCLLPYVSDMGTMRRPSQVYAVMSGAATTGGCASGRCWPMRDTEKERERERTSRRSLTFCYFDPGKPALFARLSK